MSLIAVYGNLIYDQLLVVDAPLVPGGSHNCVQTIESAGGLANFCRVSTAPTVAISSVGNDVEGAAAIADLSKYATPMLEHSHHPTSSATVIADLVSNMRTGIVKWGACREKTVWKPVEADWHHLMYLDRMRVDSDALKQFPSPVSADFCNINDIDAYWHLLPDLDYLIVSELDAGKLKRMAPPTRKGIIVHSPDLVYSVIDGIYQEHVIQKETGLNVVGAGDYFAAYCIANLLKGTPLDLASVHDLTLDQLRRQS